MLLNTKTDSDSDCDDCLDLDVSVFKKPKQEPKPAPPKNTEMHLKVSNLLQDNNKKQCVLVTMKTHFYTLKANGITSVLKLFFESIFQRKKEQKRLFGGCCVVREHSAAFSEVSEVRSKRDGIKMYL